MEAPTQEREHASKAYDSDPAQAQGAGAGPEQDAAPQPDAQQDIADGEEQSRGADAKQGSAADVGGAGASYLGQGGGAQASPTAAFAAKPQPLPYSSELEAQFGVALGDVQAFYDPKAQNVVKSKGVQAFAMGNKIAFASPTPPKEVVAHEIAHIIQQDPAKQADFDAKREQVDASQGDEAGTEKELASATLADKAQAPSTDGKKKDKPTSTSPEHRKAQPGADAKEAREGGPKDTEPGTGVGGDEAATLGKKGGGDAQQAAPEDAAQAAPEQGAKTAPETTRSPQETGKDAATPGKDAGAQAKPGAPQAPTSATPQAAGPSTAPKGDHEAQAQQAGKQASSGGQVSAGLASTSSQAPQAFGEGFMEGLHNVGTAIGDAARSVRDSIVDWGVERIQDAGALLQYVGAVDASKARWMVDQIAGVNQAILESFLRNNPAHQLARYVASKIDVARLAALVVGATEEVQNVILTALRTLGRIPDLIAMVAEQNIEAATELALSLETQFLPAVLERTAELAGRLFNEWWPASTGFEGMASLSAGVKVPVWPEPPIEVGGSGAAEFSLKLYNKTEAAQNPTIEFTVANQVEEGASVGVVIPELAGAEASVGLQLATELKATTRFGEVDWNTGLITALRAGNHRGAWDALCTTVGNLIAASQFGFKLSAQLSEGAEVGAGLGEIAKAKVSALMALGLSVGIETPNAQHEGSIEADGNFTATMAASVKASIPGIPGDLEGIVGFLTRNASAGARGSGQIGGKIVFKIPASELTDMAMPTFDYLEFYAGATAAANLGQEALEVSGQGAIRFGAEDLANWQVPDLSDGMTAQELTHALPFSQLSYKGSVQVTSGLLARLLRDMLAGDSAAARFFISNPTIAGKVELNLKFTKTAIVQLLVDLGAIRSDANSAQPEGSARGAVDSLMGGDLMGFLGGLGEVATDLGEFMFNSIDKIEVSVRATETRETPDIPIDELELSARASLTAAYSHDFSRDDLATGAQQLRQFVQHAVPPNIGRLLAA